MIAERVQTGEALLPNLRIVSRGSIQYARRLPAAGEVQKRLGDAVKPDDVLVRGKLKSTPVVVAVADAIGVKPTDLARYLLKQVGERVETDELLARKKGIFGFGRKDCYSPVDGVIKLISPGSGEFVIEPDAQTIELVSRLYGHVVSVSDTEGVVIECLAGRVQGVAAYGADVHGQLCILASANDGEIRPKMITEDHAQSIIVGGYIGPEALSRADEVEVAGVIVGGVSSDVYWELGETGHCSSLLVTDGFGCPAMSPPAYAALQTLQGEIASIFIGTPPGCIQPEVIVSLSDAGQGTPVKEVSPEIGATARVVAGAHFGRTGAIVRLPAEPVMLESGLLSPVLELELSDGNRVEVPAANIELIG